MGLFGEKTDYDELYRRLSSEKMTSRELKKVSKILDKLERSGDRRAVLWRPLISVQYKNTYMASDRFSVAERTYGICEEYVRIRSLPMVFDLFCKDYEQYPNPGNTVFVARAYEHGWGTKKNHDKAVEIIRTMEKYPRESTFRVNQNLIKDAYLEIVGTEFPVSEASEQKTETQPAPIAQDQSGKEQMPMENADIEVPAADTDDEWESFDSIQSLHEKYRHPELFHDPRDRYIKNSCEYLEPFMDDFFEEFDGGDYAETRRIIAEILGVDEKDIEDGISEKVDFIRGFSAKDYIIAAMQCAACTDNVSFAPYLANLAYYLWKYNDHDGDYFDPLFDLFAVTGEYDDDDAIFLCAMLRIQKNGNLDTLLEADDEGDYDNAFAYYDERLEEMLDDDYLPGANGKMYLIGNAKPSRDSSNRIDYLNGDYYIGASKDGVRAGYGSYYFTDGSVYTGWFKNDKYDGCGTLNEPDGRSYKGMWMDDMRHGYGEQTYANGDRYCGWWENDQIDGFGVYYFADGSVNVGEYKHGYRNGIVLIKREGKWYGGKWIDGNFVSPPTGPEVKYFDDGSKYAGQGITRKYKNALYKIKQGYGEYQFSKSPFSCAVNSYIGQFNDDHPHGTGIRVNTITDQNPYIIFSDDFRGEVLPEGKVRMVEVRNDGSAFYYVGDFRRGGWMGTGTLYVIGDGYNLPYGVDTGSIVCCGSFYGAPDGEATVTDRYGDRRSGRFIGNLWNPGG